LEEKIVSERERFNTTLYPHFKKLLKIQAAKEGIYLNELLEKIIQEYVKSKE
jgi:predicted HicB family RNase H-like nuclease